MKRRPFAVTLTLSPREAYLLATLMGNFSTHEMVKKINKIVSGDTSISSPRKYVLDPPFKAADELKKETSLEEVNKSLFPLYNELMEKIGEI